MDKSSGGTPLFALLGVIVTAWLTRRSARELGDRSTREELMRHVRWAAGLALDEDQRRAEVGVDQLVVLSRSALVDAFGQDQIDTALQSVVLSPRDALRELGRGGNDPDAIELDEDVADRLGLAQDVDSGSSRGVKEGDA